ncbi:Neuropeptide F receptor [Schistosoma japonicum]|uniref:Neuropeptide F receptor n=1 Tax=Schistosoma japonicum TaxID=6182 RepID=A0A4Z2DWR4_SCHJA|nr:Neuropeptide F receptor [Schistosoma japonicum]
MRSELLEAQIVEENATNHSNLGYDNFCSNIPQLTSSGYLEAMIKYVKYCVGGDHNEEMLQILTIELTELNSHNLLKLNELIILICIYTMMILFGSCGSLLVIYTVMRKPKMRTPRNLFILNLAISDLILCLFTQPFNLLRILYWHYDWKLGQIMCKSVAVGQATNIFVSTISIIAIALDRLQVIVYPTRNTVQNTGASIIIIGSWLFSLIMASPMFIFTSVSVDTIRPNGHICSASTIQSEWLRQSKYIYGIITIVFQYCLPLTMVSYAYIRICFRIRQRQLKATHKPNPVIITSDLISVNQLDFVEIEPDCNCSDNKLKQDNRITLTLPFSSIPESSITTAYEDRSFHPTRCYKLAVSPSSNSSCENNFKQKAENSRFKLIQRRQTRTNTLLASITLLFVLAWLPLHIFNAVMDQRESRILNEPFDLTTLPQAEILNKTITDSFIFDETYQHINSQMNTFTLLPDHNHTEAFIKVNGIGRKITLIHSFCLLCVLVSACANPVLYGWLNENFHREFILMFPMLFRPKKQQPSIMVSVDRNYASVIQ